MNKIICKIIAISKMPQRSKPLNRLIATFDDDRVSAERHIRVL